MGKDKKRKNREKRVRAENEQNRNRKARQQAWQKRTNLHFEETDEDQKRLECEILLIGIGLEVTSPNVREARNFLDRLGRLAENFNDLSRRLDELFTLAQGHIPLRYADQISIRQVDRFAVALVKKMRGVLNSFEQHATPLFTTTIGMAVKSADKLSEKLRAATIAKEGEIRSWHEENEKAWQDHLGAEGDDEYLKEQGIYPFDLEYARDKFIEATTNPLESLASWQLGIPTDFYRDIVELAEKLHLSATLFFLRQIYTDMTAKERHVVLQHEKLDGMIPFEHVLRLEPEKYLPDPAYLEEQKCLALRLNSLNGGEPAVRAFERLREKGFGEEESIQQLEKLGTGRERFKVALDVVSSCSQDLALSFLERCSENPSLFPVYEKLREATNDREKTVRFLIDYGNYRIGDITLSELIKRQTRRPEAIRLLVDNALTFCCGEGAEVMVALLDDLDRSTRALRFYLSFAQSEEPYKQLAILRYLKRHSTSGLESFTDNLRRHRDEWIGSLLQESDSETLFRRVAEDTEPTSSAHPLKSLSSFDLIMRYGLISESGTLTPEMITRLDRVLNTIRETRFEAALLGQAHLRQQLMERLAQDADQVVSAISHLPPDGNPYLQLKEVLNPTITSIPLPAQIEERPAYRRVVLISSGVSPETISYLEIELGIPVHEISVDASGARFTAIRPDDVVVYCTTVTSHSAYYRAKNRAVRQGAAFRHTSRINREALVEVVRS